MSGYRQIHTRMWSSDRWFTELSPEHKLLFVYLFSNERTSVSGLYELPVTVASFETGLSRETVYAGMIAFEQAGKVLYDPESGVVYVRNMFKYQGSNSPKLLARLKADIKAVPACALKNQWILEHRVLIGYEDGSDTPISISISSSISSSVSGEGGGAGEETKSSGWNWVPETPKEAGEHPDIQAYVSVCGYFPGQRDYWTIIETVQVLREKHGDGLLEYLRPFWAAWSSRRTKTGKPYSAASLVWLCEWAMQGKVPQDYARDEKPAATSESTRKSVIAEVANARN